MSKTLPLPKLPTEFKQKWVAALRSGEYKQGQSLLLNGDNEYCCLGVACKVAGYTDKTIRNSEGYIKKTLTHVPIELRGLDPDNALVEKLIGFNDDKEWSFNRIAAYVERYL